MKMTDMSTIRRAMLAGTALAGISLGLLATPAAAQDAQAGAETAAAPVEAGEIVVTAQRREQKLNDVGIAVSVLSAKEIKALNIVNATDVVRAIPNLKFNAYGSSQVVYNIRGVSQNDYGDQQEPPVAVYQDDAYTSSITAASFPIFDLARVEALRGPQGTLFGRNATGGAVQFISAQPTEQLDGYLSATYGRFNQVVLEGALSGALSDTLTARISGQYTRDDGYIKNITPGQPDRGADNHWALRGIIQWKPSSDFKAKLTLRYAKADRERQAGLYSLEPTCPNAQFQGEFLGPNQVCSYWGVTGTTGNGYANPAITPSQGGNPWRTAGTGDAYVDRDVFGATLRLDAKIGAFDVTSITDYQHLKKFYIEQGNSVPEFPYVPQGIPRSPGPCPAPAQSVTCYESGTVFFQRARTNQVSQEIRAAATFGQNYLTIGGFGMIIDGKFAAKYAVPFIQYDPDVNFTQRTESFAFFAQDEFKINDQWKLIGGIRYWQDKKRGVYNAVAPTGPYALSLYFGPDDIRYNDTTGTVTPGSWSFNSGATSGVTTTPGAANPTFRGVTARAEIDYKPNEDTLIYASYNRGSKSGGFTFSTGTPFPTQLIDVLNNIPYQPETLNAYEVGVKAKLPGNTQFNLSAFYYDYKNYQAFVQVFAAQVVRNLPAKIKGIEADITSRPIPGLTLQLSGAVQDSEVKNVLLPDGVTVKTSDLPQAPSFAGNALVRYEFDTAIGRASLQADALYTSKFCFTVMCAPVEREGAYAVANVRVGFTPKDSNFDLAFFVNNLFERRYRVYAFDASTFWGYTTGVYAKPRTWGVNAVWHFGK
ncbi:TonB-dependent receptor [Novosphingobium sp.]|uniref:TonB-dependent receptor n=1 Tax=Novosphingobium sp. TaxID=1874826 RepID=UPI001DC736AF|nr:TonB-dependent receptor [Novosphingobium sp.]MBX9664166.1 TonB-dependent receptor [Novosphingobium sp.]